MALSDSIEGFYNMHCIQSALNGDTFLMEPGSEQIKYLSDNGLLENYRLFLPLIECFRMQKRGGPVLVKLAEK